MRITARKKSRHEKGTSTPFVRVRFEWLWHRGQKYNKVLCSQSVSFDRDEATWIDILQSFLNLHGRELTQDMLNTWEVAQAEVKSIDPLAWEQFQLDFPGDKTGGSDVQHS